MQNISHTNLEEKPVWPDLTFSGEDVHAIFCIVDPDQRAPWDAVPDFCRPLYEDFAKEINRIIEARQAWTGPFEDEDTSITAIKCPTCGAMLTNLKGHPCL
jgi:hypothetical protein